MSWREQLRPAQFRNATFFVDQSDADFGRRIAVHEYPFADRPQTEDLGERARQHSLDAYVLGSDYMVARDALELALNTPGAGELVHPYRGTLLVVVTGWRVTESIREGGIARFSLSFIEFEALSSPSATLDTARIVTESADAADVLVVAAAERSIVLAVDSLRERLFAPVRGVLDQLEQLLGIATTADNAIRALLETPRQLVARVDADLRQIRFLADIRRWFDYALPGVRDSGQAQANRDALNQAIRAIAVIHAVRLSAGLVFRSRDEAFGLRDELLNRLDTISLSADDDLFPVLLDTRAALVTDIRERSVDLARLTRYTPGETLPALVVAHQLYGLANVVDRAEEIVDRNRVAHPGFLIGGVALEVLSD